MRFPCLIIGILAVLLILVLLWTCRVAGPPFHNGNGLDESLRGQSYEGNQSCHASTAWR